MKHRGQNAILICVLSVASLVFLFPILWMLLTALKPASEIFGRTLHFLPTHPAWHNFAAAWSTYNVRYWLLNSTLLAILGGALNITLDLLAGYAFAKFQFPGRDVLFVIFLCTLMLPAQVFIVPQFMTVAALGGVNTYWAVLLPRAAETYGVFLARQFLQSFPDELLDAARLDGASEWNIFLRLVLPLSKPAIAVLSVLLFLGTWNDFGWPLVILKDEKSATLPVGLSMLQGEHVLDWSGIMVVVLISILPVTLMFIGLQRYFVQGISRTGIK